MATPPAAGREAGQGEGNWDAVVQSMLSGVCPASEAALQWAVKGSCVPKLRGLSVARGIRRTPRNMISFKTCDYEVLRVQHPPIGAERRSAETALQARRIAGAMFPPVRQGPLGAIPAKGRSRPPLVSVAPPPAPAAGGRARTPPARVRAFSVQPVCEREWEVAGLGLWPSPLTDPAQRLQP